MSRLGTIFFTVNKYTVCNAVIFIMDNEICRSRLFSPTPNIVDLSVQNYSWVIGIKLFSIVVTKMVVET